MTGPMNSTGGACAARGGAALTGDAEADSPRLTRSGEGIPRALIWCAIAAVAASGLLILAAYLT